MFCRLKLDIEWQKLLWACMGSAMEPAMEPALEPAFGSASSHENRINCRDDLIKYWPGANVVTGLSVRTLFHAILTELSPAPGTKIIMSAITIQNMAEIAQAHGLEIVAVDIDPQTLVPNPGALLEAQRSSGATICVLTQLFGAVTAVHDVEKLQQRGVFVIEDAAQSFAGDFYSGDPQYDASLFSFGPIKRHSALGGGIGVFKDEAFATRILNRLNTYPKLSEGWFRKRAAKYILLKLLSLPKPYGVLVNLLTMIGKDPDETIGRFARSFAGRSLLKAICHRPPDRMMMLLSRQIADAGSADARVEICTAFAQSLPSTFAQPGSRAGSHAYWLFPVSCDAPASLIRHMRQKGFDATRGATSLCVVGDQQLPGASRLLETIVYLPNPADMSSNARQTLLRELKKYADQINAQ